MKCTWKDCKKDAKVPQLDNNKKKWEYYMINGFGKQIAILNNLKTDEKSILKIIKNAPKLLLQVK